MSRLLRLIDEKVVQEIMENAERKYEELAGLLKDMLKELRAIKKSLKNVEKALAQNRP